MSKITVAEAEKIIKPRIQQDRERIWEEIMGCLDADIDTVSGEPSWYLNISIDNITLERIIFGKNGVRISSKKEQGK